jgi:hypothetical protein
LATFRKLVGGYPVWVWLAGPALLVHQGVGSESRSVFSQLLISRNTRSKIGSEGCGCLGCGIAGSLGGSLDGLKGVAHPASSIVNTASPMTIIGRTGAGNSHHIVNAALPRILQTARFAVRSGDTRVPLESYIMSALPVCGEV